MVHPVLITLAFCWLKEACQDSHCLGEKLNGQEWHERMVGLNVGDVEQLGLGTISLVDMISVMGVLKADKDMCVCKQGVLLSIVFFC